MSEKVFALALVGITIFLGAVGQLLQKKGLGEVGQIELSQFLSIDGFLHVFSNFYIFLGVACYVVALFLWLAALSRLQLSFMYPLISLGYVLTALLAWAFLGESISVIRWSGILLVVLGSWLILQT